ncbi:Holliday junction branch migration DNA helicase RuvB [Candidatus Roizmanbacteria bacterium CG22_combo_CG10-13_8_21_14_all_38_20]|uniref:Holliday junction branch migration complex subunit RuvB n=1 Tax=Candidatus Roizmanbacteria bacterium CG22_combo_CG10-13_8_21_14_all_38_20 TaxID=1974862 RepID=A0A2H0BVK5_9BACT|nr:MAG: Holliday junction branch migration DNA helicase RuvB [Candidatus Roizmanbacteria bacterium CG22_combo_CG10-13_8_21_14_all_38_20]PJC31549.1 MAG: Holliday junction branch migration DNA helicase RuvB [Candidatus Roizmanbacteria bacterium CG_4_9_14_0_2_um_filter_38_17]
MTGTLRPQTLNKYIGQSKVVSALSIFISAAKKRGTAPEHVLFYGPPGIGKTTLAYILANELGGGIRITSGPAVERAGDLAAILTSLKDKDVLFIDEIHRLPKTVEEALYPVMEESVLDIIIGKGPAARTVRLNIPNITIIGATTRVGLLSSPLRDRFGLIQRLDFYSDKSLSEIITKSALALKLPLNSTAADAISRRARKTPRIANRILKRVRDFYEVGGYKEINEDVVNKTLHALDIDELGLEPIDKKYLLAVITKYGGGPVGIETLAMALSEDTLSLEDYVEPFLIRTGLIKKTARGRMATKMAYEHLGLKKNS